MYPQMNQSRNEYLWQISPKSVFKLNELIRVSNFSQQSSLLSTTERGKGMGKTVFLATNNRLKKLGLKNRKHHKCNRY
jgi:hypothetical protein